MAQSAFAFYRGAAAVMAADLGTGPNTGLAVQLCGDAHLLNFGLFAAPDRRLVFSINDFDETLPGPFEWDVKRLGASIAVAARELEFDRRGQLAIVARVVRTYREAMHEFASMGAMDLWYARLDLEEIGRRFGTDAHDAEVDLFRRVVRGAQHRDSLKATAKLTRVVGGRLQFVNDPPILVRVHDLLDSTTADHLVTTAGRLLSSYRSTLSPERRTLVERFRCVDLARKVVGVGSVGTRTWVALMLGRDERDPLILQFKQAESSVLEPYLHASQYDNHGRRVVEGQRLMQAASDVLLGWQRASGLDGVERDYYVRQLWDKKGSADPAAMSPRRAPAVREHVCLDPRPGPCAIGRLGGDRRLPRQLRSVRAGDRGIRRSLRRPERMRSPGTSSRDRRRIAHGRARGLTATRERDRWACAGSRTPTSGDSWRSDRRALVGVTAVLGHVSGADVDEDLLGRRPGLVAVDDHQVLARREARHDLGDVPLGDEVAEDSAGHGADAGTDSGSLEPAEERRRQAADDHDRSGRGEHEGGACEYAEDASEPRAAGGAAGGDVAGRHEAVHVALRRNTLGDERDRAGGHATLSELGDRPLGTFQVVEGADQPGTGRRARSA